MRPTGDLAFRARNWFWYWLVRHISGLSNEQLDQKCFGDLCRRRHFERIQASASAPDKMAIVDGETLLAIVDSWDRLEDGSAGPYSSATKAFHSPFWTFLASKDLTPKTFTSSIQEFAAERGWMRVRDDDRGLYETFLGKAEPAIEPGMGMAYSAMLHRLVNDATPDGAAILVALFREAMLHVDLDRAVMIRRALTSSIGWMGERLGIPKQVTQLIRQLIVDRILGNRWISEADWRIATNTPIKKGISSRARVRELHDWVQWYVEHSRKAGFGGYGMFPIVPVSTRTKWLEANRSLLEHVLREVDSLNRAHNDLKNSSDPALRQFAEESRTEADRLIATYPAPEGESELLYRERPDLEMMNFPRSYPYDKTRE